MLGLPSAPKIVRISSSEKPAACPIAISVQLQEDLGAELTPQAASSDRRYQAELLVVA